MLNGTVDPTTEGNDGDFYINTTTMTMFGPKAAGAWPAEVSLVGPQGAQGPASPEGPQGPQGTFPAGPYNITGTITVPE